MVQGNFIENQDKKRSINNMVEQRHRADGNESGKAAVSNREQN